MNLNVVVGEIRHAMIGIQGKIQQMRDTVAKSNAAVDVLRAEVDVLRQEIGKLRDQVNSQPRRGRPPKGEQEYGETE